LWQKRLQNDSKMYGGQLHEIFSFPPNKTVLNLSEFFVKSIS
jgi:hypothetical protein